MSGGDTRRPHRQLVPCWTASTTSRRPGDTGDESRRAMASVRRRLHVPRGGRGGQAGAGVVQSGDLPVQLHVSQRPMRCAKRPQFLLVRPGSCGRIRDMHTSATRSRLCRAARRDLAVVLQCVPLHLVRGPVHPTSVSGLRIVRTAAGAEAVGTLAAAGLGIGPAVASAVSGQPLPGLAAVSLVGQSTTADRVLLLPKNAAHPAQLLLARLHIGAGFLHQRALARSTPGGHLLISCSPECAPPPRTLRALSLHIKVGTLARPRHDKPFVGGDTPKTSRAAGPTPPDVHTPHHHVPEETAPGQWWTSVGDARPVQLMEHTDDHQERARGDAQRHSPGGRPDQRGGAPNTCDALTDAGRSRRR